MSTVLVTDARPRTYRVLDRHGPNTPVALGVEGTRTALDLVTDAETIAASLPTREGDVLVICSDRYLAAACILAAWSQGRSVALPPNAQPGRVCDVADAASTAVVLHDSDFPRGMDVRRIVGHSVAGTRTATSYAAPAPIPAERCLATIWTSGSTGTPQLCTKTAAQLLGEAEMLVEVFAWRPGAVTLSTVPAFHLYGLLFGILGPMVSGGAFVRETPLFAPAVAAALLRTNATLLVSVPAHLCALEGLTRESINCMVPRVCSSGAPLTRAVAAQLATALRWTVTEIFGSTETGGIGYRESVDASYVPFPGVTISTTPGDSADEERLVLRSPFTNEGTASAVATNDRVRLERDGRFVPLGRADTVVKVAGKRVSVAELESRLRELPGVRDAVVIVRDVVGARGTRLAAVVEGQGLSVAGLREALRVHFDPVVVPRPIVVVDALPREATGKLRRDRLLVLLDEKGAPPLPHPGDDLLLRPRDGGGFDVHIPVGARAFEGHFPGYPVLPGVVQLDALVVGAVCRLWPELRHPRRITRLKFRKPVLPGDDLVVRVDRLGARVTFSVERDGAACATGTLFYGETPSEGSGP